MNIRRRINLKERSYDVSNEEKKQSAARWIQKIAAQSYADAWEAKKRGEKVGWCASNFPQEILETMDVKVTYPENHAAAVAAKGGGLRMCEQAENEGYSNDLCAYARINLAYMDVKECPEINMPQPDFVACCNNICNCMIKWYENIAYELNIPLILIDVPYNNDFDAEVDRVEYMRGQFEYAIKQLEVITGREWDHEKFVKVMETSQRTGRAWIDAVYLCSATPSPYSGFDVFNHMAIAVCARGKEESAEAFEALAAEYREKIAAGTSGFKGEEKYRVVFEGIACWPHLRHTYKKLQTNGINVTGTVYADAFGYLYNNTYEMLRAYCCPPNAVSYEKALDMRLKVIEANNVDGMLMHINRSCKQWSAIMYEMQREIEEKTGIPVVMFDGDQADPRNFSEAQYDTRIETFIDVMDEYKAKKEVK